MDPNHPMYSQISQHFSDLGDDFLTNPQIRLFVERLGNTFLQNPSQQQTPSQIPQENTYTEQQTPPLFQGSNSQYDDSQEDVPETPQSSTDFKTAGQPTISERWSHMVSCRG